MHTARRQVRPPGHAVVDTPCGKTHLTLLVTELNADISAPPPHHPPSLAVSLYVRLSVCINE